MLIGGLMVQAHGLASGIDVVRPTVDVDMVVLAQLRPDPFGRAIQRLLGYEFRPPVGDGPAHRSVREQAQTHNVVGTPIRLATQHMDLSRRPFELLDQIRGLAAQISADVSMALPA